MSCNKILTLRQSFHLPKFEYDTRILHAADIGAYGIGYDEIDLNGDGKDKFVLMNENY